MRLKSCLPFAYKARALVYPTIETEENRTSERPDAYPQRFSGSPARASLVFSTCRSCAMSCAPDVCVAGGAEACDQEAHSHREEQR